MTTAYSQQRKVQSLCGAIFLNRLIGIGGTAWIETAGRTLERGDTSFIKNDDYEK
jgi:hypothetical protein